MALSMSTNMFTARAVRPAVRASSEDKVSRARAQLSLIRFLLLSTREGEEKHL